VLDASVTIDPAFRIAPVRRRLFGSFVEHLGRCVYTGIHDPGHPTADPDGFRGDVAELVRELGVSTVRYPGGNFVSGYRWEDGVGPVEQRPVRRDLAWHSTEPNTIGVDEFVRWCRRVGVEPMLAVNLGTRGVQEAVDLLEYCNVGSGTALSDRRRANGSPDPHRIRMWCLGNELDGPWQIGHKTAQEYGRLAAETARAMRLLDPDLELVACGSSNSAMPTFGSWEATVLAETYDQVDYVSAHAYYQERDGDTGSFLASAMDMDHFVESVVAAADHVRSQRRVAKRIHISFDEWNVWYQSRVPAQLPTGDSWPVAPELLEDRYTALDAVVVGSLLICLLRHSDRVHAASLAQLVNVIAPIVTEPGGRSWRQTTFHPFALTAAHAAGDVLRVEPTAPVYETAAYGETPVVDAVATVHDGAVSLFAVNRSTSDQVRLATDARALGSPRVIECVSLSDPDLRRTNTADSPGAVVPRPNPDVRVDGGRVELVLPAVSWTMLRLAQ
jgi:alpha-N-arabinofuranosidase